MARLKRQEVFVPDEIATVHVMNRVAPDVWCQLVGQFGKLFSLVAGKPQHVDSHHSRRRQCRFHLGRAARELMQSSS